MEICPSHRKPGHILVMEMKRMSNGGNKIWYDLLQPSFVIRIQAQLGLGSPRAAWSLEDREKCATENKNLRTNNHALRGKMINNGCEEWNINNPEYLQC